MINQESTYGRFGKLEERDRVKVTLYDNTIIEGNLVQIAPEKKFEGTYSSVRNGGIYVGVYFIGWEKVSYISVVHRPTEDEKFKMVVAELIHRMDFSLDGKKVPKDYHAIAARVIALVRDHDSVEETRPQRALKTPPPFAETSDVLSNHQHVMRATPAHQDREETHVIDIG